MSIDNISQLSGLLFGKDTGVQSTGTVSKNSFDDFFQAAMDMVNETNTHELQAQQAQLDYVTGKDDNLLSVMLAQDRAYTSLNFTVQVTNKVVEAYREIMRMQL